MPTNSHEPPKDRQPIELSVDWMELVRCNWACSNCRRGIPKELHVYAENGIDYYEAECLRCGVVTRDLLSEVD